MLRVKPLGSLVFLALGAASAIIGLLPWLIYGMRLPLQNLWASATTPAEMPIALLPLSQYSVVLEVALLVIGSAVAGVVGRAVPARHPGGALAALVGGVLVIQLIVAVQSIVTVFRGLSRGSASTFYLAALVGATIVAILLGMGVLALIARAPKAGALIGLSVAAIAFGSWLSGIFFPISAIATSSPLTAALGEVVRFAPAVLIGLAIAWCGITTAGRVAIGRLIAAVASLLLLWVGPTLVTAVSAAVGSRVLAHYPGEMVEYGVQVFRSALGLPELWLTTLALAIVVAAVGLVAVRTIGTRANAPTD